MDISQADPGPAGRIFLPEVENVPPVRSQQQRRALGEEWRGGRLDLPDDERLGGEAAGRRHNLSLPCPGLQK